MLQSEWGWVKPSLNVWSESFFFCVFLFQLNSIFLGRFLSVLKLLSAVFWVPLLLVNCWNTGGEARMYYPSTWPAGCLWSCLHSTGSIWERLVLRCSWINVLLPFTYRLKFSPTSWLRRIHRRIFLRFCKKIITASLLIYILYKFY